MTVFLDECVNEASRKYFPARFVVITCREMGWAGLDDRDLLPLVATEFEAMFTIDRNMAFQTSLKGLPLKVAIGRGDFRSLEAYLPVVARFAALADELPAGRFTVL